ncbi:hypothetical protein [Photobacterium phosphoreum]|uniref:hypothetical protein n=1 Tax=Photobacterium phosphoreum TaxID=659 RepID=UPI0007F8BCDD|nr:hypothetical protein [Photobacterium phosphoreum]OBU37426.1 hypothetical protein AYY24_11420 [Photobacterium phosphoreum]
MENLNWRALEFILNAAAQNTLECCNEEVLFLVGLIIKQEQKRQLDAACVEELKAMIIDYEVALLARETLLSPRP